MSEKWTVSSNKALSVSLVSPTGSQSFHPDFTYPIYGEQETIYGYSPDLKIDLRLSSASLTPYLNVTYKRKNENTTAEIDDVVGKLRAVLPAEDLLDAQAAFEEVVEKLDTSFKPLGELLHTYHRAAAKASGSNKSKGKGKARKSNGAPTTTSNPGAVGDASDVDDMRTFEIYRTDWNVEGWTQMHRRMQIFTLLFIEGASYIQEDETAWEFLTIYEKLGGGRYAFVGYTSLYRFWCYPDRTRLRLSQFLVLPPYQHAGHGSELYTFVLDRTIATPSVSELTVEDPSEAFDRVRDGSDLRRLFSPEGGFIARAKEGDHLKPPMSREWSEKERAKHKMAPRQWARLMEMCQLLQLDQFNVPQVKAYRLQVKARIYRFNRDILKQMEQGERVTKLQQTFEGVVEEYAGLTGVDVDEMLDDGEEGDSEDEEEEDDFAGPARKMARFG